MYYILYSTSYIFILQNNDKLSLVVGRRHVHVKRKQSCVNGDEVDEVDGGGNSPIKTNFPAISHSRSRSEPAIQQSDLEITASEIDSEDSSSEDDDEAGIKLCLVHTSMQKKIFFINWHWNYNTKNNFIIWMNKFLFSLWIVHLDDDVNCNYTIQWSFYEKEKLLLNSKCTCT